MSEGEQGVWKWSQPFPIPEKEGNGKSTKLDAGSVVAADGAGTGGGQLWAYDPKGDVQMEVPQGAKLTGWPKLTPETMAPGFPHDIRHKFFEFDGVVPHAVLPYTGNQLSIVYFARSKYLTIDGQVLDDRWSCACDWRSDPYTLLPLLGKGLVVIMARYLVPPLAKRDW